MEISFTVNTTEQLFTKWIEERARRSEGPRFLPSASGDRLFHLMNPSWGNPMLGINSNLFVVCGSYTYYKANGDIDYVEGVLGHPFIAFHFLPLAQERIDVIVSIDDSEPLVRIYITELLLLIAEKYPETHDELKPYFPAQSGTKDKKEITSLDNAEDEQLEQVKKFLPKKEITLQKYKDSWKIILDTRANFAESYDNLDTEQPNPSMGDYMAALGNELRWKPSDPTIRKIIKLGEAGLLE